jgi:spore coat protein CotH
LRGYNVNGIHDEGKYSNFVERFCMDKKLLLALLVSVSVLTCRPKVRALDEDIISDDVPNDTDVIPLPGREFPFEEEVEGSLFEPGAVMDVRVTISEDNWNQLRFERREIFDVFGEQCMEPLSDVYNYYPADMTVDGEALENIGIRTKGFFGSINPDRPSLKVKIDKYEDGQRYKGHKRFTFNNQNQDFSRLITCMSYYIFRQMGVPASRCSFAKMRLNDANFGVYTNVEPIKKPMLARLFGDDSGNLYEGTIADLRTGFTARIEKKTNEETDDWSDMEQLIAAIESPDEAFVENLEAVLDLDAFLRFMAVEAMVNHWDGFSGNLNNYYFYKDPSNDKFYFIPWGIDAALRDDEGYDYKREGYETQESVGTRPQHVFAMSMLARRLYEHPDTHDRYRDLMGDMLRARWNTEEFLAELERMRALINPHVFNPNNEHYVALVANMVDFIENRKDRLLTELDGAPAEFEHPLRDEPMCFELIGSMTATFETTWGTLSYENPWDAGSGTMEGSHAGNPLGFDNVGVKIGLNEEEGEEDDRAILDMVAIMGPEQYLVIHCRFPPDLVSSGATLTIPRPWSWTGVEAHFVMFRPGAEPQSLGAIGPGAIEFEDASTEDGAGVKGSLHFDIWGM